MATIAAQDAASRRLTKPWWRRRRAWQPEQDATLLWLHQQTRQAQSRAEMLREYDVADRETLRGLCEELDNTSRPA